jgi:hypothetical protein
MSAYYLVYTPEHRLCACLAPTPYFQSAPPSFANRAYQIVASSDALAPSLHRLFCLEIILIAASKKQSSQLLPQLACYGAVTILFR